MISKKLHSSASYYFIVKLGIHTFNHILLSRVLGGNDYQFIVEDEHTISLNLNGIRRLCTTYELRGRADVPGYIRRNEYPKKKSF